MNFWKASGPIPSAATLLILSEACCFMYEKCIPVTVHGQKESIFNSVVSIGGRFSRMWIFMFCFLTYGYTCLTYDYTGLFLC